MIYKYLIVFLLGGLLIGCNSNVSKTESTENTAETTEEGIYGDRIKGENPISGDKLVTMLEESDSVWVTMRSEIVSNCQHSGCWMDLDVGNEEVIKVTFKDYAFFVPLDSQGKTATIEGYAKKELIPVDMLKHYAEDDGKSLEEIDAITEPQMSYTFEAIGVIISE